MLYQQNTKVTSNERIKLNELDHSLIITDIKPDDQANYSCRVLPNEISLVAKLIVIQDNGGAMEKASAHIYASDGRDISDRSITFRQGERIEIECKGRPKMLDIKWFVDGKRVVSDGNVQIDGNKMTIKSANRDHDRLYQCLADGSNDVGSTGIKINIQCKHSIRFCIIFMSIFSN